MSLLTEAKMPSLKDKINSLDKEKVEVAEEEVEEKVKKPKKAKKK